MLTVFRVLTCWFVLFAAADPVAAQQRSRAYSGILFVSKGKLWLEPHLDAANARPIARLVRANAVPSFQIPAYQRWYYGHMDWRDLFAWY